MKKAQKHIMGFWYYLIVALVMLIIIFVFISNLQAGTEKSAADLICRQSIEQNIALKLGGFDFSSSINCPTKRIIIKQDLKTAKGQNTAKKIIADEMLACWQTYKQGKENLFSGNGLFCSACAVIEFEKPNAESLNNFAEFFLTQKIKEKGISYSYYFNETKEFVEDNINTSDLHAIVFYYAKGQTALSNFISNIGPSFGISGYIFSWVAKRTMIEWKGFVLLVPYEKENLFKGCTYLPAKQGDWWSES